MRDKSRVPAPAEVAPRICYGITTPAGGRPSCWRPVEWSVMVAGESRDSCTAHLSPVTRTLMLQRGTVTAHTRAVTVHLFGGPS